MKSIGEERTLAPAPGSGGLASGYTLSPGDTLGQYKIIRSLGRGGMGEVYLCEHAILNTRHAVKLLPVERSASGDFVQRFHDEARVMARLEHTGIVSVVYADADPKLARHYLVMDFVGADGSEEPFDMEDALAAAPENRLQPEIVARLGRKIAEAVGAAHANGVIHRDLKPANVLLTSRDLSKAEARVADFGLARLLGEDWLLSRVDTSVRQSMSMGGQPTLARPRAERDSTGAILGTYEYMSPEQREGRDADERSDIYALGVMLYRMVTGKKLIGRAKAASKLVDGLDESWDDLIDTCLEESPEDRPVSMAMVASALERFEREARQQAEARRQAEQAARKAEEKRIAEEQSRKAAERRAEVEKAIPCSPGALSPETEDPDILRRQSAGATELGRGGATELGRGGDTGDGRGVATGKSGGKGWVWALFITLGLLGAVFYANRDSRPATTTQTPSPPVVQPPRATPPPASTPTPVTRTPTPAPSQPAVTPPARRNPIEGQNWTSPATGMEFVWIPAMNLWVGKFEVTNGEYRRMHPNHNSGEYSGHSLNGDRQPVVRVNFDDAKAYAEWLTEQDRSVLGGSRYRLPSEQEWMTYAQCGDGREYPWGNEWPPPSGRAGNYSDLTARRVLGFTGIDGYDDGSAVTAPVERLWRNPWGLHGVGGNVWEACASDSTGGSFGAWRGASWSYSRQDILRCSARCDLDGSARYDSSGFRLVLSR